MRDSNSHSELKPGLRVTPVDSDSDSIPLQNAMVDRSQQSIVLLLVTFRLGSSRSLVCANAILVVVLVVMFIT